MLQQCHGPSLELWWSNQLNQRIKKRWTDFVKLSSVSPRSIDPSQSVRIIECDNPRETAARSVHVVKRFPRSPDPITLVLCGSGRNYETEQRKSMKRLESSGAANRRNPLPDREIPNSILSTDWPGSIDLAVSLEQGCRKFSVFFNW